MKALMFGWEFPPHILGGLGTASYGLTRGMAQQPDMEITFVIPKPWGDEDQSFLRIIGANSVPVVWKENSYDYVKQRMEGRMSPEEYFHFRNGIHYDYRRIGTDDLGCIAFSGRYPDNLIEEIGNYEAVASVLAHSLDFDIIHSHDWLTYPPASSPSISAVSRWSSTSMRPTSTVVAVTSTPPSSPSRNAVWKRRIISCA